MTLSFFERLFKYSESDKLAPRENFLTEIFAFVLEQDLEIRSNFLKTIRIEQNADSNFNIDTQKSYYNLGRPDIEIEVGNCIVLIENKIESEEGENQLSGYIEILKTKQHRVKKLVYLTKYYEQKEMPEKDSEIDFFHLKWFEIAKILRDSKNLLTQELLKYLTINDMVNNNNFNAYDLVALQSITGTLAKMNYVIDVVVKHFDSKFGKSAKRSARFARLEWQQFTTRKYFTDFEIYFGF